MGRRHDVSEDISGRGGMKMYLDISGLKPAKVWPESTPKKIPICKGIHERDYDIVESEMPAGWREEYNTAVGASESQRSLPVGFDIEQMPASAKIVHEE
jgi:hypothetical protein